MIQKAFNFKPEVPMNDDEWLVFVVGLLCLLPWLIMAVVVIQDRKRKGR